MVSDDTLPEPLHCDLAQLRVTIGTNEHIGFWVCVFRLTIRNFRRDLIDKLPGVQPVIKIKLNNDSIEGERDELPFECSFSGGVWTIEVVSPKIIGLTVEAFVRDQIVPGSPLIATLGPEKLLWGEEAGTIIRYDFRPLIINHSFSFFRANALFPVSVR